MERMDHHTSICIVQSIQRFCHALPYVPFAVGRTMKLPPNHGPVGGVPDHRLAAAGRPGESRPVGVEAQRRNRVPELVERREHVAAQVGGSVWAERCLEPVRCE